jgi:hypothetical protein
MVPEVRGIDQPFEVRGMDISPEIVNMTNILLDGRNDLNVQVIEGMRL